MAVGGDGTVGEVASGIMDRTEPHPRLAIVPGGTGNDIGRNVGVGSVDDAVSALRSGRPRAVDLIRMERGPGEGTNARYGLLCAAIGFSSIPKIRPWMKRLLGPAGAYYLATLLQVAFFRVPHVTLRTESRELSQRSWLVIAANAERSAGGIWHRCVRRPSPSPTGATHLIDCF